MRSVEDFESAMKSNQTYMSTLVKSLGNVLDAFYQNIRTVGVSSVTGQGIDALFERASDVLNPDPRALEVAQPGGDSEPCPTRF